MEEAKNSFSQIYDQYVTQIYRFVYLKTGSRDAAEDLASEVFIRGWESYAASFSGESSQIENMRAFLYGIARNIVADYYRKGKRVQFVSVEETRIEVEIVANGPEELASVSLEMDRIRQTLLDLPQDYQDLIIWRYLDEMSVSEIAQLSGKTEENVRVGLHRGLKLMKGRLPQEQLAGTGKP